MQVTIKQVKGLTFIAKGESNHWTIVDSIKEFGGSEAGLRPLELLLVALGSCTASDVASILDKKRVEIKHLEVNVVGKKREEHPKVFTRIDVEYVFYGENLEAKDIERAIDLSQNKYCPVVAMLNKSVDVYHSYKIIDENNKT